MKKVWTRTNALDNTLLSWESVLYILKKQKKRNASVVTVSFCSFILKKNAELIGFFPPCRLFRVFRFYGLVLPTVTNRQTVRLFMRDTNSTWTNCPKCNVGIIPCRKWADCAKIFHHIFHEDGLIHVHVFILTTRDHKFMRLHHLLTL